MKSQIKIKVVGVGGAGGNTLSRMKKCGLKGVELIAINSDVQDLKTTKADLKIQIGKKTTKGFGAGMNPRIGEKSAQEAEEEIKKTLLGGDIIFIACGLGGGTGSGASPVIAQISKELGALTIGVVTLPFSFEGLQRQRIAKIALSKLKERVDTLIVISNDKFLGKIDDKTDLDSAFFLADEISRQAVYGILDLIATPGLINVDLADLNSIMKNAGIALFGVGKGKGEERIKKAAEEAINSPFLDFSIKGAKGVLFNITGGKNLTLFDVERAAKIITNQVSPTAKIIFGAIQDPKNLLDDEIRITVIATGI
jgi:cell division protein FtsZ